MKRIERQEALIEELTTRGTREVFHDGLKYEDSMYSYSYALLFITI